MKIRWVNNQRLVQYLAHKHAILYELLLIFQKPGESSEALAPQVETTGESEAGIARKTLDF